MNKTLKNGWLLVLAAALVLPVTVVRADDEDSEEVTTSDEAKPSRKLSGAEEGSEDEAVADTNDGDEEATTASNEAGEAAAPEKDERAEKLFKKLKALVKQFDKRTKAYPSPVIESAVRNEFLRQAEGKRDFAWLRGKNLEGGDRTVAQDNFELFLNYAEKLGAMKAKAAKDADLLIVKGLIDRYGRRGISANEPPEGLGKNGRAELKRQNAMLGRLVSGPGYEPLKFAKLDDAGKAYKARLVSAKSEFEKLAKTMGGSKKVVKRSEDKSEKGDRKPASTKGKKAGKDKSKGKKKHKK